MERALSPRHDWLNRFRARARLRAKARDLGEPEFVRFEVT